VTKQAWNVELFDSRAQLYVNGFDYLHLVTPNRPRIIGLRMFYRFGADTSL
jgi:hypothetical protein